jgi:hypothetical protein
VTHREVMKLARGELLVLLTGAGRVLSHGSVSGIEAPGAANRITRSG